jgi:hypothetical protein
VVSRCSKCRVATSPPAASATTPLFSQAFHNYLVNCVEMQTLELKELGLANKALTNNNNFLKGMNREISALNKDIARQLRASNKQFDKLKGKLTMKVMQF